jgi:hypothetical protein
MGKAANKDYYACILILRTGVTTLAASISLSSFKQKKGNNCLASLILHVLPSTQNGIGRIHSIDRAKIQQHIYSYLCWQQQLHIGGFCFVNDGLSRKATKKICSILKPKDNRR